MLEILWTFQNYICAIFIGICILIAGRDRR